MTPAQFIARWQNNKLNERAGAQGHFDDLCDLLGVDKPRDADNYCFERGAKKSSGKDGWADVWKRNHFAWENKKPGRDLDKALKQLTDSIRNTSDDRATIARGTLDSFRFDSSSFGLTDIARAPAVAFMVPGNGVDGEALALNLPPIQARTPEWWTRVVPTLPTWAPDSSSLQWSRGPVTVLARPQDNGDVLAVVLRTATQNDSTEWPVTTVRAPAFQLIALDQPALAAPLRAALARAFDASATHNGDAHVASTHVVPDRRNATRQLRTRIRRPMSTFRTVHLRSSRDD